MDSLFSHTLPRRLAPDERFASLLWKSVSLLICGVETIIIFFPTVALLKNDPGQRLNLNVFGLFIANLRNQTIFFAIPSSHGHGESKGKPLRRASSA
jgi:hypothetical protein